MAVVGKLIIQTAKFRNKPTTVHKSPAQIQHKTFKKLIKRAVATEFGNTYLFEQILTSKFDIALFQKLVPISTYEQINKTWWKRMRRGDKDTCWPGRIKYFALSSGTSDASTKYIPVSKHMIRSIRKTSMLQLNSLGNFNVPAETFSKQVFLLGGSTHLEEMNGKFYGDMSGISALTALPGWFIKQYYKPGYKITSIPNWNQRIEEIVKHAKNWDIGIICGIPSWVQLVLEKIINHYQVETIHDVWPNLNLYIHGGIFFEPYKKRFTELLKREIAFAETYMASEGYYGFTNHPQAQGIKLVLNKGIFYEFIAYDDKHFDMEGNLRPNATALTLKQVKEDVNYALIISNNSGAWRYITGDTIRFISKKDSEILITGRINHYLNTTGEHLSVQNMVAAIEKVKHFYNLTIQEFTVISCQDKSKFFHKWFVECETDLEKIKFADKLDAQLQKQNDDYKTARQVTLNKPVVVALPTKEFYRWMKKQGKVGDQFKVPRVMTGKAKDSWLTFLETRRQQK